MANIVKTSEIISSLLDYFAASALDIRDFISNIVKTSESSYKRVNKSSTFISNERNRTSAKPKISSLLDYFAVCNKKKGEVFFREFRVFRDLRDLKDPKDLRNLKKLQSNYRRVHRARCKIPKQALYFARLFVPLR